uniref:Aldo-keto reductase n=1 Tax=Cyberlindnera americana TaxID=36016 RepID=A0A5P8N8W5_9ASCO|nr:aldo-keto reductase [Cyberlindnera americana]
MNETTFTLNTGAEIPQIALGTWAATDDVCYNAVLEALKCGYRHIDTAALYRNEVPVGKAIKDSGVPREEIFVTTKLYDADHKDPAKALDESLERLGLSYVDLYLMHWPVPLKKDETTDDLFTAQLNDDGTKVIDSEWDFIKTWELMQKLSKDKAKALGVSNFSINNLKQLMASETTTVQPAANQCECYPLLPQDELISYCKQEGIVFEAYCPMGSASSPLFENETLQGIAEAYGVSAGEIMINWGAQRGYVLLPKSANPARIANNKRLLKLKPEDFDKVSSLVKTEGELRHVKRLDFAPFPIFQ